LNLRKISYGFHKKYKPPTNVFNVYLAPNQHISMIYEGSCDWRLE